MIVGGGRYILVGGGWWMYILAGGGWCMVVDIFWLVLGGGG